MPTSSNNTVLKLATIQEKKYVSNESAFCVRCARTPHNTYVGVFLAHQQRPQAQLSVASEKSRRYVVT